MPKAATKKDAPAKKATRTKAKKDPNAPKKPSGAYIFFCNAHRAEIKKNNPDYGVAQIGKELGALWKDATDKDKEVWELGCFLNWLASMLVAACPCVVMDTDSWHVLSAAVLQAG